MSTWAEDWATSKNLLLSSCCLRVGKCSVLACGPLLFVLDWKLFSVPLERRLRNWITKCWSRLFVLKGMTVLVAGCERSLELHATDDLLNAGLEDHSHVATSQDAKYWKISLNTHWLHRSEKWKRVHDENTENHWGKKQVNLSGTTSQATAWSTIRLLTWSFCKMAILSFLPDDAFIFVIKMATEQRLEVKSKLEFVAITILNWTFFGSEMSFGFSWIWSFGNRRGHLPRTRELMHSCCPVIVFPTSHTHASRVTQEARWTVFREFRAQRNDIQVFSMHSSRRREVPVLWERAVGACGQECAAWCDVGLATTGCSATTKRLICMVNDIIDELMDMDGHGIQTEITVVDKYTQTWGPCVWDAGKQLGIFHCVRSVKYWVGSRYHLDGKGFQGVEYTMCKGLGNLSRDKDIYRSKTVPMAVKCKRVLSNVHNAVLNDSINWSWSGAMINKVRVWETKILRLTFSSRTKLDETWKHHKMRTSRFLRNSWRKTLDFLFSWCRRVLRRLSKYTKTLDHSAACFSEGVEFAPWVLPARRLR